MTTIINNTQLKYKNILAPLKLAILLFVVFSFSACEKLVLSDDLASENPQENFEYLWKQCDTKYSYFELKGVDWEQIHSEYAAKISEGMSNDELFNVLGSMLVELKDDHTNLISKFNISIFGTQYLGQDNFDWRIITNNYIHKHHYTTGPFQHDFLLNTNNEIGYVRFSAFTGTVDDDNLDFVLNKYKDTKGLILDLRENGGGAVTDLFSILGRFVEETTTVYHSRIKTGEGHNDFSDPEAAIVEPSDNIRYTNKVMVLTDRGTFSAGSFFSLATKALPNMVLLGDTTGGGLGLPNGGQLPNGWTYRFSITQALDANLSNAYEMGVPPDITVQFDWSNLDKDEIIEQAIIELNK